jgi:hypothetical protein
MKLTILKDDILSAINIREAGGMFGHKIRNKISKVWQPVDYSRTSKTRSWMNAKKIYAATTSIDKPYAEQGL